MAQQAIIRFDSAIMRPAFSISSRAIPEPSTISCQRGALDVGLQRLEAVGVLADEGVVEHTTVGALHIEHHLHQPLAEGDVAVDAHRQVHVGQGGAAAVEHAEGEVDLVPELVGVGIGEAEEARARGAG